MQYYRVFKESQSVKISNKISLIANELFTEKELSKYNLSDRFIRLNFERVTESKRNVYFFFGARFSLDKGFQE